MSSSCNNDYSYWATNVCNDKWCYADYNCGTKCCDHTSGNWYYTKCTSDMNDCMGNLPSNTGCGYTSCSTTEYSTTPGNMCDGQQCTSDNDCASKCCDNVSN